MTFNEHSELEGKHAFLSASKGSWVNYDEDKLIASYKTAMAAAHGTRLHEFAKDAINLRQKLPRTTQTLNMYVNDCISLRMTPEQVLAYSVYCFGTADAIRWDSKKRKLYIFDLKTGINEANFRQLIIYAALFCLEYDVPPSDIEIELRIYQNDNVKTLIPELHDVVHIMSKIKTFDRLIRELQEEGII